MSKFKRLSDVLLICLLVLLTSLVIAYAVGYAPQPGTLPFWAVIAFLWSIRVLGFALPVISVGYAVYLLRRIVLRQIAIENLVQCIGLLVMGLSIFPGVGFHGKASWAATCAGIVFFGLGRRLEKKITPPSLHR